MLTAEPTFVMPIATARPEPMEGVRPSGVSKLDLARNTQGQLKRRMTTKPLCSSSADNQPRISQDKAASVLIEVTEKDAQPSFSAEGAADTCVTDAMEQMDGSSASPPGGSCT